MSFYHSKILQLPSSEVNRKKKQKYQNEVHGESWIIKRTKIRGLICDNKNCATQKEE